MTTLNTIFGFTLAVAALIVLLFPKHDNSPFLKRICWSIMVVGVLFSIFNTNQYKHWKYFEDQKIQVVLQQLPHVIVSDNNLSYAYVVGIENNYLSSDIKEIEMNVNSRMPIQSSELLLSDGDEKNFNIKIKDSSNIVIKSELLRKGEVLWISFRCNALLKNNLPNDIKLVLRSTPISLSYKLYDVVHSKRIDTGLNVRLSNKRYFQKDIVFEKVFAIDHRKSFSDRTDYQHCQFSFDDKKQTLSVIETYDGFVKVIYSGLKGKLEYKSNSKININIRKIDIIRMIVLKNDFFLLEGTFSFSKEKV